MSRRPAFRASDLELKVLGVALGGLLDARRGDRPRAVRAVLVLEQVARLPSPGLARAAQGAAESIREALGHPAVRAQPARTVRATALRAAAPVEPAMLAHAL